MLRVGLVGCGTIGSRVARTVEQRHRARARIAGLHDSNPRQAQSLQRRLRSRPPILSLAELIRRSDLVVEAASVAVAAEVARRCLRAHRDVIVMSSGGLLLDRTWRRAAARSRGRVFLPSGALAGLDGVRAMGMGRIRAASLTTSKPPRALEAAPYVKRFWETGVKIIDLSADFRLKSKETYAKYYAEHPHPQLLLGHLQAEDRHRDLVEQGGVLDHVDGQGGFAHAGARGDDDQITRL